PAGPADRVVLLPERGRRADGVTGPRRSGRAGRGKIEKQKEGKKRMRQFGKVEIPQEAFIAALKMDGD
ncbi:MAG: hypothetical protein ACK5DK_07055, partial [Brevundimonas sp.]|uniref:hypothetical protein n=1 Tax=Brevundimonas sp. TaxID=1871086 RepID=UPI0039197422